MMYQRLTRTGLSFEVERGAVFIVVEERTSTPDGFLQNSCFELVDSLFLSSPTPI
jgi:hypothetical protein